MQNQRLPRILQKTHEKPSGENNFVTWSDRLARPDTIKAFSKELGELAKKYRKIIYREECAYLPNQLKPVSWILLCSQQRRPYVYIKRRPAPK